MSLRPGLVFIPSRFSPWVLRSTHLLLPLLRRVRLSRWLPTGIRRVRCEHLDVFAQQYEAFQSGHARLLLAFRHCEVTDPLCIGHAFAQMARARRPGFGPGNVLSPQPMHSHFLYDRGMPLWAGRWLGWYLAAMGGIPVHRGRRLDLTALRAARSLLLNGHFPLAIAPEGATNGHSQVVGPLEPGAAQLAFWGLEDLRKANRPEPVVILPIGLQYHYLQPDWRALHRLLGRLEQDLGLGQGTTATPLQRLERLAVTLMTTLEDFYRRFYPGQLDLPAAAELQGCSLDQRLQGLIEASLTLAENHFNLPHSGHATSRCRRLEEAGWNHIYREDVADVGQLSPLERGLGNWAATTAGLAMAHMRLVESCVAISADRLRLSPDFDQLAEISLILFDLIERMKGTTVPRRPQLGWRQATVRIGEPINVGERWGAYGQNRRAAKAEVARLTADLQRALEALAEKPPCDPIPDEGHHL